MSQKVSAARKRKHQCSWRLAFFGERCLTESAGPPGNWQTGGMTLTDPVTAGAGAKPGPGQPCVLLKQGGIFLKGRNRQQFQRLLHANVRAAVRGTGVPAELTLREGVLVLRVARDGLTTA